MYHISLIHSSIDEHLGCFHVLDIVNNAAMNVGVHMSFLITTLSFFFFNYFFLSLAPPGLSCSTWDLQSSLWHGGSLFVAACKFLVAAFEFLLAAYGI